jgi:hypothetical protein
LIGAKVKVLKDLKTPKFDKNDSFNRDQNEELKFEEDPNFSIKCNLMNNLMESIHAQIP